jgi:valyl-tRNA synthetase
VELDKARSDATRTQAKLDSDFSQKAPEAVVTKERERLAVLQERIVKLEQQLTDLR